MTAVLQAGRPGSDDLVFARHCPVFLVIALSVSVGELSIPLDNVFYAISNKMGLTEFRSTASMRA
jgi:hypothetical protein